MTTSVDPAAASVPPAEAAGGIPVAPQLGRDEFLRLLVAKLQNQDPLKPASDTEFIAELATFSSLEQLISVNDNLETLGATQAVLLDSQSLNLIGKQALLAGGDSVRIDGGQADTLIYTIPRAATEATLEIRDAAGNVVRTFELETTPRGRVTLEWDGTDADGNALPDGEYGIEVRAVDGAGDPMAVPLLQALRIDGASFYEGRITLTSAGREIPFDQILEIRESI